MSQLAYVNGAFVAEADASVSIFDRGFLFGDGVYEVTPVLNGRLIDRDAHLARLGRSLREIGLEPPLPLAAIDAAQQELAERNSVREGRVYLQITRGPAERDFNFPDAPRPTVIMFSRAGSLIDTPKARDGIRVCTVDEQRWARRDIKSVNLLAQVLAKHRAHEAGAPSGCRRWTRVQRRSRPPRFPPTP